MTTTGGGLTREDNWFEDFVVGDLVEHGRGKTMTEMDNVLLTNLVLNTAQGHFNEHRMADNKFGQRITFGGITAAMVIGLASQDTSENSLGEIGVDSLELTSPVFHGDTIYAFSEVLEKNDTHGEDVGEVAFRHWGVNQREQVVFEGVRRVLVRKRIRP